jgi:hypothetical protein
MHISVWKYTINIVPPTCFGHSCGHPQGGALKGFIHRDTTNVCEPVHSHKDYGHLQQENKNWTVMPWTWKRFRTD